MRALASSPPARRGAKPPAGEAGAAAASLDDHVEAIRRCRLCRDAPLAMPLPHPPRPILQASATARLAICSQAPGNRAHRAGRPFQDPSGVRLRTWLGLDEATFYDPARVAIVPMGFCFPGYDRQGGDLPPRRECAATWHDELFRRLPRLALKLCIGRHSINYHLPHRRRCSLAETVRDWRTMGAGTAPSAVVALPHPSWRNNAWLARNPWFEAELVPELRARVARVLAAP